MTNRLTWTCFVALAASCFGQKNYTSSPVPNGPYDLADLTWISDDAKTGFGAGLTYNPFGVQCFSYQGGVLSAIATPGMTCQPAGANAGNFVFSVTPVNPSPYATTAGASQLFAFKNGQLLPLPLPAGTALSSSPSVGVNSAGQMATTLLCPAPAGFAGSSMTPCAYAISSTGAFTRLPDLGGYAYATAINANGDIAGWVAAPGSTTPTTGSLVVWPHGGGTMKNLSAVTGVSLNVSTPASPPLPVSINAKGQIVGPGYLFDGASSLSALQFPSASKTTPVWINENGEIVGSYRPKTDDGIDHPFYYANGTAADLNALVTGSSKFLSSVWYINNAGQILVSAVDISQSAGAVANGRALSQVLLTPNGPVTTPIITSVLSAASFAPGTASSTWITIQGINLSAVTDSWASSNFANGNLPTALDGVSVTINGVHAYPSYVSPAQINVLAPDDGSSGPVQVQVTNSNGVSNPFTVTKSDSFPAFFTVGATYVAAVHADGTLVGPPGMLGGASSTPARQGETIQVFGTGFGPTVGTAPTGEILSSPLPLAGQVTVKVGGQPAQVLYAGRTANGLDQLNVTVPNGLADGDAPIQATINGLTTQPNVLISVHD